MAAACTAMELHDRRLSISKASASKISKPSPLLKNLSSAAAATAASSPSSASSSPPTQLPSSITSSPSRPIAKVVNADPSSFRRVVQELTGTTFPSTSSPSSTGQPTPRSLSRLQRSAPPPLRSGIRTLQDAHHHQTLLEQMQHQQASQMLRLQQNIPKVGALSPPLSFTQFGNGNPNPTSGPTAQSGNPDPNSIPSLPMLSPHLLSPLPALTPSDNTWANPIDVIAHSPTVITHRQVQSTSGVLPPLLPLPNVSTGSYNDGHENALLAKPVYASNGYGLEAMPTRVAALSSVSLMPSHGGALPPLPSTPTPPWPMSQTSNVNVLPPWSPSPIPFSPGLFPPSPGALGPPSPLPLPLSPPMAALPHVNNANLYSNSTYGTINYPNMPSNFTF